MLRIEYNGKISRQMVHISTNIRGLYFSETCLEQLGLLPEDFPRPLTFTASAREVHYDHTDCEGCDGEQ